MLVVLRRFVVRDLGGRVVGLFLVLIRGNVMVVLGSRVLGLFVGLEGGFGREFRVFLGPIFGLGHWLESEVVEYLEERESCPSCIL